MFGDLVNFGGWHRAHCVNSKDGQPERYFLVDFTKSERNCALYRKQQHVFYSSFQY